MKEGLSLIGAVSMALTTVVATPAAAQQDYRPPASVILEDCKPNAAADPNMSVGECISWARASEEASATKFCLMLKDNGTLDNFGLTMGDCLDIIR